MKSYTDLSQSKKLAEILPIESADMSYQAYREEGGISDYQATLCPHRFASWIGIPCWSLTALINVLPSATLDSSDDHWFRVMCNEKFTEWYNNPIDCCIAMIDRLHGQMICDFNNSNN